MTEFDRLARAISACRLCEDRFAQTPTGHAPRPSEAHPGSDEGRLADANRARAEKAEKKAQEKAQEKREKKFPSLAEVRDQVARYVVQKAQSEMIVGLREKAKVERFDKPVEPAPAPAATPDAAKPDAAKPDAAKPAAPAAPAPKK